MRQTIWNVDESWLNEVDFRRYGWGVRGQRYSIDNKKTMARVTVIIAFSNHGEVFFSASDQNSSTDTFSTFMAYLVE